MFVRFGLCCDLPVSDMLVVDDFDHLVARTNKLRNVRDSVADIGIAHFSSSDAWERFVSGLPDIEAARWTDLHDRRGYVKLAKDWTGDSCSCSHSELQELRTAWADKADLLVCSSSQALELDIGTPGFPVSDDGGDPEVVGLNAFEASQRVLSAREIARGQIRGSLREDVWMERFRAVADEASVLSIVDPYLFVAAARALAAGKKDSRASPLTGASWLIRRAAEASSRRLTIRIYSNTAIPGEVTTEDQLSAVRSLLNTSILRLAKRVEVWDIRPGSFCRRPQELMHQRVVGFDRRGIILGYGAEMFAGQRVRVEETCSPYLLDLDALHAKLESSASFRMEWLPNDEDVWIRTRRDTKSKALVSDDQLAVIPA